MQIVGHDRMKLDIKLSVSERNVLHDCIQVVLEAPLDTTSDRGDQVIDQVLHFFSKLGSEL